MKKAYTIKDKNGKIICTTDHADIANGYYNAVKKDFGYAEIWYKDELIFKTK